MFEFFDMLGSHDERLVANDTAGELEVDTCEVNDGKQPYETAVKHPAYREGAWVIVEAYDTKAKAAEGHTKWLNELMTALPSRLVDCCNSGIQELGAAVGCETEFPKMEMWELEAT